MSKNRIFAFIEVRALSLSVVVQLVAALALAFVGPEVFAQTAATSNQVPTWPSELTIAGDGPAIDRIPARLAREPIEQVDECTPISLVNPNPIPLLPGETITAILECGGAKLTVTRSHETTSLGKPHSVAKTVSANSHVSTARTTDFEARRESDVELLNPIAVDPLLNSSPSRTHLPSLTLPEESSNEDLTSARPSGDGIGECPSDSQVIRISATRQRFMRREQPGDLIIVPNRFIEFAPYNGDPYRLYFHRTNCNTFSCSIGGSGAQELEILVDHQVHCFWADRKVSENNRDAREVQWKIVWKQNEKKIVAQ